MSRLPDGLDVIRLAASRIGLALTPGRAARAEEAVRRVMLRAGIDDPDLLKQRAEAGDLPIDDLIDGLTVGETYFFREPDQFRFIREHILPEVAGRRGPGHRLRVWSAGCASGEEAYSLAMVLEEEGLAGRSSVLATDVSTTALAKARRASYRAWSLRDSGAEAARRHLVPSGGRLEVAEAVRRRVAFAPLNLAGGGYPSPESGVREMDLILCRNVLIYLDRDAARRVALALHDSLAEGGWLVTASTDPPLVPDAPFQAVATDRGVFYRRALRSPPIAAMPRPAEGRSGGAPDVGRSASPPEAAALRPLAPGSNGARPPCEDVRPPDATDPREAERACARSIARNPTSPDLHHLHAVLLMGLGRHADAARAARRALYIDPSSVAAHVLLGVLLERIGDPAGAGRAYRNALALCGEGVSVTADGSGPGGAEPLAAAVEAQSARIDALAGGTR